VHDLRGCGERCLRRPGRDFGRGDAKLAENIATDADRFLPSHLWAFTVTESPKIRSLCRVFGTEVFGRR
jgi:hypothetical protein